MHNDKSDCNHIQNVFRLKVGDELRVVDGEREYLTKILDISKEKMLHSAEMTCNFLQLSPNNTALLCLPIEYISGKMMLVRALYRGLHIVVTTPSVTPLEDLKEKIEFKNISL